MMTFDDPFSGRNGYYHLCSDGELTPRFITGDHDFRIVFNLIGVSAAHCDAIILSFSIEDTHLHSLLYGTRESCVCFKTLFEESWLHHVGRVRGTRKGAEIDLDIIPVDTRDYLMSVGTYTIVQPTKDGKQVMPYDYRWGTGSMYFRGSGHRSIWSLDEQGDRIDPVRAGELSRHQLKQVLGTHRSIPSHWQICNGILLPDNYVDVVHYERIYQTANCYRVFLASNRNKDQLVQQRIAEFRGVAIDDAEARQLCKEFVQSKFGIKDIRRLDGQQRIMVAQQLRRQYKLSARQIASLVHLEYAEVCKYV